MNAPAWSKEFRHSDDVEQFYANGSDELLALVDNCDTLILPLGSVRIQACPGTSLAEMSAGSLLFVPARACEHVSFSGSFKVIVLRIAVQLRRDLHAGVNIAAPDRPLAVQIVTKPQQINAIVQLVRRITAAGDACTRSCLFSIARLLLWEVALNEERERARAPVRRRILDAGKIRALDLFVEENLEEPLSLEQLAQQVGMSRYYFLRCFKEATGFSPLQYVITKRVERARDMLSNGSESIAEIAYASGFSSQSHLNWAFKRHFGVTPGAFKREHRTAA